MKTVKVRKVELGVATDIVRQITQLHVYEGGQWIPGSWRKHLVRGNGKSDRLALDILSEIFYWYRGVATQVEGSPDKQTLRRKFRGDKLQKSYKELAEKFFASKWQVTAACKRLRDMGLITLEFRTVYTKTGKPLPNTLFIAPVPEGIRRITELPNDDYIELEEEEEFGEGGYAEQLGYLPNEGEGCHNQLRDPSPITLGDIPKTTRSKDYQREKPLNPLPLRGGDSAAQGFSKKNPTSRKQPDSPGETGAARTPDKETKPTSRKVTHSGRNLSLWKEAMSRDPEFHLLQKLFPGYHPDRNFIRSWTNRRAEETIRDGHMKFLMPNLGRRNRVMNYDGAELWSPESPEELLSNFKETLTAHLKHAREVIEGPLSKKIEELYRNFDPVRFTEIPKWYLGVSVFDFLAGVCCLAIKLDGTIPARNLVASYEAPILDLFGRSPNTSRKVEELLAEKNIPFQDIFGIPREEIFISPEGADDFAEPFVFSDFLFATEPTTIYDHLYGK